MDKTTDIISIILAIVRFAVRVILVIMVLRFIGVIA